MALTPDMLPWLRFRDPGLGLIYFPVHSAIGVGIGPPVVPCMSRILVLSRAGTFDSMRPSQIAGRPGPGRRGAQQRTQQGCPASGHWSMGWGSLGPKIWTDGCHQLYMP